MKRLFSTLILVSFLSMCSFAQEKKLPEIDKSYHKYLDDGIRLDADANIKFSLLPIVEGFVELQYEQKISKNLSLGLEGSYQTYEGFNIINDNNYFEEVRYNQEFQSGYGYGLEARFYGGYAITRFLYGSLHARQRISKYSNDGKQTATDVLLAVGVKKMLAYNLNYEVAMHGGPRFLKVDMDSNNTLANQTGIVYGLAFKLGYYLKY